MIRALVTGRLHGEPQSKVGASGAAFATAGVWIDAGAEQSVWCSAIAFGDAAQRLLGLKPGDSVALSGRLTPKVYARPGNEARVLLPRRASDR